MNRRTFGQLGVLGSGSLIIQIPEGVSMPQDPKQRFPLHFAPHIGMFRHHAGEDPIDQLGFVADAGFTALEDNEMRNRPVELQEKMAATMTRRDLRMGVFVAHTISWQEPNLTSGNADRREEFLNEITSSIEVAKRVNARWMTVVPGHLDLKQEIGYQTANVIETLKRASEILEPHDLTMVLEPLNFRDHPGLFLTKTAQAFEICKAVDSPSCKILFDIYHQQITEGNLIPNMESAWEEIAYFQLADNPGRFEPTTGEINYLNIFRFIASRGFTGILGMEHGNAKQGIEGEKAVIEAYKKCSTF
jgi:hydroxypyruvate isomerase